MDKKQRFSWAGWRKIKISFISGAFENDFFIFSWHAKFTAVYEFREIEQLYLRKYRLSFRTLNPTPTSSLIRRGFHMMRGLGCNVQEFTMRNITLPSLRCAWAKLNDHTHAKFLIQNQHRNSCLTNTNFNVSVQDEQATSLR